MKLRVRSYAVIKGYTVPFLGNIYLFLGYTGIYAASDSERLSFEYLLYFGKLRLGISTTFGATILHTHICHKRSHDPVQSSMA